DLLRGSGGDRKERRAGRPEGSLEAGGVGRDGAGGRAGAGELQVGSAGPAAQQVDAARVAMPGEDGGRLGSLGVLQAVPEQRPPAEGDVEAELHGAGSLAGAPEGAGLVPHGCGALAEVDGAPGPVAAAAAGD